ncbi:DUF4124 domain-containing protein [Ideonella sp.]|uniref:DUF4124 domain-containing protein n=1 Tax=Ideonella sp. TaxID=1929293 RepID=UPI0035B170C8
MHAACAGILAVVLAGPAAATPAPPRPKPGEAPAASTIYTCTDSQGRRLSSDRPIPECMAKDQQLLNRDGSVRAVVPPAMSPEEAAKKEAARRAVEQARAAREAEARRDRALLARYPDAATHDAARARAQEPVTRQIETAQRRLKELEREGEQLQQEREALGARPVSQALRHRLAANEGAIEAQLTILRGQEAERDRLNRQFDLEMTRLRALWAGAAPGAMGPLTGPATPAPARDAASGATP